MGKVYSKALDEEILVDRYIGKFEGDPSKPTIVAIGGIHGNEPSGVFALNKVCDHILNRDIKLNGSFYALSGNLCALPMGRRYCDVDLNRIWTSDHISKLESSPDLNGTARKEDFQMHELLVEIKKIVARAKGELYFIDLHTTSSQSCPFIPINDTLANRNFAQKFPVPTVLGIEEFLEGPLLSYINEIDHIALGFEGGQHDEKDAIKHHIAFMSLVLLYAGLVKKGDMPQYETFVTSLSEAGKKERSIYEIRERFGVENAELFEMESGYKSFDLIYKGQKLATYNGKQINASEGGKIFMPLYQKQGDDGFFIIRRISPFWLNLSSILRRIRFESVLILLPGVKRDPQNDKTLIIDRRIARFMSVQLFHLLGYRMKQREEFNFRFTRRERR